MLVASRESNGDILKIITADVIERENRVILQFNSESSSNEKF